MRGFGVFTGALLLVCGGAAGAAPKAAARCTPGTETSRRIVRDFYQLGLVDRHPAEAFHRYMTPDFVEHKGDLKQPTREGIAAYLQDVIDTLPQARWQVVRIVAEGDMVALHARMAPTPGAPAYGIADFFRLKGCKIAEHWDVVAAPPKEQRNPNSRF